MFEESEYNCVTAIMHANEMEHNEDSFDDLAFQQIMTLQDIIPVCLERPSYEDLIVHCPKFNVKKM